MKEYSLSKTVVIEVFIEVHTRHSSTENICTMSDGLIKS